jgi:hypothetical protein
VSARRIESASWNRRSAALVLSLGLQQNREAVAAAGGLRMHRRKSVALDRHRLAEERFRLAVLPALLKQLAETVQAGGELGGARGRELAPDGERFAEERLSLFGFAAHEQELGKTVETLGQLRIVLREELPPRRKRRAQARLRGRVVTEVAGRSTDRLAHRRLDERLARQLSGVELRGRRRQRLDHGDRPAAVGRFARDRPRVGRAQHLLDEGVHRLRLVRFPAGACRLPARGDDAGDQDDEDRDDAADERLVAPCELPDLVGGGCGPREDRLVGQVAPDVRGELGGRGVAPVPLLRESLRRDRLDVAAEGAVHGPERRGLLLRDRSERVGQRAAVEVVGEALREQLVEDDAQRVDVAADIEIRGVPRDLLGAHVGECPYDLADARVRRRVHVGVGRARHAEVEDLRLARLVDEHVPRLEIAVDDPLLVRVVNAVADPRDDLELLARRQAGLLGVLAQGGARDQLHREVRLRPGAGVGGARFEDLRDARVMELAEQDGLLLEAPERLWRCDPGLDHFQGDLAPRVVLERLVHRAHPALADQAEDDVGADALGERWDRRGRNRCGGPGRVAVHPRII